MPFWKALCRSLERILHSQIASNRPNPLFGRGNSRASCQDHNFALKLIFGPKRIRLAYLCSTDLIAPMIERSYEEVAFPVSVSLIPLQNNMLSTYFVS